MQGRFYFADLASFSHFANISIQTYSFLSASDFLASIAYILSFAESAEHCNKQDQCAVLGFFFALLLMCKFYVDFCNIVQYELGFGQRVGNDILQYEKYYHILTWGTCIVLSVTPLFFNAYGDAGSYCWIKTEHERYLGTFVYYIPLLLVMVMSSVNFFLSLLKESRPRPQNNRRSSAHQD